MVNPTGGNVQLVNPDWKDTAIFSGRGRINRGD